MMMDELILKLQTIQQEAWGHGVSTDDLKMTGFLLGDGQTMEIKEIFVDGDTLHFDFVRPTELQFKIELEYRRVSGPFVSKGAIAVALLPKLTQAVEQAIDRDDFQLTMANGGVVEAHSWEVSELP